MTYYKSRLTKAKVSSASPVVSAADDGGDGRARAGAYAPFLLVATATFFAFLSIGIVLPVLPRYTEGPLGAGDIGVGIAVGAASLTALLAQPPAGRLGDLRGRRPLMIGGGILMVLGAAGLVVAEHIVPVVGLRLLTGVGEALFLVGGISVVNDLAPDHRRGEAVSLYTIASYSGLAIGPVLGELTLGDDRWDAVWLLAAACSATAGVLGFRSRETRPAVPPSETASWLPHRLGLLPGVVLGMGLFGMGGFIAFITLYALDVGLEGAGPLFAIFAVVVVTIRSLGAKIPDRVGPARTVRFALVALAAGLATIGMWSRSGSTSAPSSSRSARRSRSRRC